MRVLDFVARCLLLTHFCNFGSPVFLPAVESGDYVGCELLRSYLFWCFCAHARIGIGVPAVAQVSVVWFLAFAVGGIGGRASVALDGFVGLASRGLGLVCGRLLGLGSVAGC